jgi:hypothetical protein
MHAKHADGTELIDLSGHVGGGAFTMLRSALAECLRASTL